MHSYKPTHVSNVFVVDCRGEGGTGTWRWWGWEIEGNSKKSDKVRPRYDIFTPRLLHTFLCTHSHGSPKQRNRTKIKEVRGEESEKILRVCTYIWKEDVCVYVRAPARTRVCISLKKRKKERERNGIEKEEDRYIGKKKERFTVHRDLSANTFSPINDDYRKRIVSSSHLCFSFFSFFFSLFFLGRQRCARKHCDKMIVFVLHWLVKVPSSIKTDH